MFLFSCVFVADGYHHLQQLCVSRAWSYLAEFKRFVLSWRTNTTTWSPQTGQASRDWRSKQGVCWECDCSAVCNLSDHSKAGWIWSSWAWKTCSVPRNLLMRHLNSLSHWPRCSRVSPPEQEVPRECDCPVISGVKVKDLVDWHYIWIVKSFATDYHLKSWKLANIHVIPGCLRSGNFIPSRSTSLNWTAAIN